MLTMPPAIPVTTPVELTVAIDVLLVIQVPPEGVPTKVVDEPIHTLALPVMVAVDEIVIVFVTKEEPTV